MSRALNDDEVLSEMNKMVAFIKQEALEKAREIKVKADEEFAIEKAKLVRQEQQAIDAQYEKKRKGAEVAQKIAQSTITNKSRLKLLHKREEILQQIFAAVREPETPLYKTQGYVQFLEGVLTESFLYILEPNVTIYSRESDVDTVKQAAENAAKAYKEISGRNIAYEVEGSIADDSSQGGVKLVSGTGRITLDNTMEERLRLLEDKMLPEIRTSLFGKNENRKFYT
ncbi:V-type proton ATPase subunit E [Psilocybe cubensis]|uniref:V-type proton ATPase subunit E n=2 Tax=Psilocybe cubensis TaxID=181762 RepID=A0A8H7XWE6_PSICU|nr:V-type proton ATPase subunit E [Psilocybe cubensis]KAH9475952.1 V-type proton ATPase subunit E [Psilocybe cubensis]